MMNLRQILRSSHVKRWHIVETSKQQTVAEHIFNVCMIAEEICQSLELPRWDQLDVIEYALHHDTPEAILGDIPTPTKNGILGGQLAEMLRHLERNADPKSTAPNALAASIVKLADTLDAVHFLALYGVGSHAAWVRTRLVSSIDTVLGDMVRMDVAKVKPLIDRILCWETADDTREDVI